MTRKKWIVVLAAAVIALMIGVGLTLAYFIASSQSVENTFTLGNVRLTLSETTGQIYALTPGVTIAKDPTLTVQAGSEACWVFFTAEESADLREYVTYTVAEGWTPLDGHDGVYYRQVAAVSSDTTFPLLQGNVVQVRDTVTEEQLASLRARPTLTFIGYAIQDSGIPTAQAAWEKLLDKEVTGR